MGGWGGGHGEEVRDGLKVSSVDIEREEVPKCGCSHTERSVTKAWMQPFVLVSSSALLFVLSW